MIFYAALNCLARPSRLAPLDSPLSNTDKCLAQARTKIKLKLRCTSGEVHYPGVRPRGLKATSKVYRATGCFCINVSNIGTSPKSR